MEIQCLKYGVDIMIPVIPFFADLKANIYFGSVNIFAGFLAEARAMLGFSLNGA